MHRPIERIASITMGEDGYEKPRRNAGDVELYFPEGAGRVTLKLKDIIEGRVSGSSENFGTGSFDIRAFDKLIFNIYTEKKKEEEDDW